MMIAETRFARRIAPVLVCLAVYLTPATLPGQSLTEGALEGVVTLADGTPVGSVELTLRDEMLDVVRHFRTDIGGRFFQLLVAPGTYSMLAERAGYQPIRYHQIRVVGGERTVVRIVVARRPPPITRVEEVEATPQRLVPSSPRVGEVLGPRELNWGSERLDLSELGRQATASAFPGVHRFGFATAGGGLPQAYSRFLVDGLPVTWMRHPGIVVDPAGAGVFPRYLIGQAQVLGQLTDLEAPDAGGLTVNAFSQRGTEQFRLAPFVMVSGRPGIGTKDNPADSSVSSLWAGLTVSGALIPGRARFVAGFHYQDLEYPTARPWQRDSASFGGGAAPLVATLTQVAQDSFGTSVGGYVQPVVRTWRGGAGGARVDWSLSPNNSLMTRVNLARWKEQSPLVGEDVFSGAGGQVESRDFSGTVALTSLFSNGRSNEFRVGYRLAQRDWTAPSLLPTYLVGDGVGIGGSPLMPGKFREGVWDFGETFHVQFGAARQHLFKVGAQYSFYSWRQNYIYGRRGIYQFGDLDQFGNGVGTFFQAIEPSGQARFKYNRFAMFGQFGLKLRPGAVLTAGLRWSRQKIGRLGSAFHPDTLFRGAFGLGNSVVPHDGNNYGPHVGFTWETGRDRSWVLGLGWAVVYGAPDPAVFSEVLLSDGSQRIRRGIGTFSGWPVPDTLAAPVVGRRFALFGRKNDYADPRTSKFDLAIRKTVRSEWAFTAHGGYHHTDYLLRRTDLNLVAGRVGTTQEGRPVYGTLVQQGGLLVPQPGSNRSLPGYDMVSALAPTGFSNYVEAGISVERGRTQGLSLGASYLFSRTRDNWPRSHTGDPADELSPFPAERPGHEWVEGRSDFDVPHQVRAWAEFATGGSVPVTLGARYRFRSGLPYTPGFRPGVDANGDGSGNNDPAWVDPSISGLSSVIAGSSCLSGQVGHLAERNSCRSPSVHALDVSLVVGLPVRSLGGRVEFTAEGLNLVASEVGLVDRALVLVDPQSTVTDDGQGNITLPLVANTHFGKLLSRRTENRIFRLGLRLAY